MFSSDIFISQLQLNEDNFSKLTGLSKRFFYIWKNNAHILPVQNNGKESIKAFQPKSVKAISRMLGISESDYRILLALDQLAKEGICANNISLLLSNFPGDVKSLIMHNHSFFV